MAVGFISRCIAPLRSADLLICNSNESFAKKHDFTKPNDARGLHLMNAAAKAVMKELPDIRIGYGVSDEFSFVFDPSCNLFQRRKE